MIRRLHRWIATAAVLAGLYYASTGLLIQALDGRALLRGAPATDPTMQAIRVGIYGPPNFQVLRDPDHAAEALPAGFDPVAALAAILPPARAVLAGAPLDFVEFRMLDGRPVAQVASARRQWRIDLATASVVDGPTDIRLPP